jgi:hypothetical protein
MSMVVTLRGASVQTGLNLDSYARFALIRAITDKRSDINRPD